MPFFSRFFKDDPAPSSWDYEGVMTVGDYFGFLYGWENKQFFFGSINPENPSVQGYFEITQIWWDSAGVLQVKDTNFDKACNDIEINGILFTGFDQNGSRNTFPNPFPAVGQTCTIKLR